MSRWNRLSRQCVKLWRQDESLTSEGIAVGLISLLALSIPFSIIVFASLDTAG